MVVALFLTEGGWPEQGTSLGKHETETFLSVMFDFYHILVSLQ